MASSIGRAVFIQLAGRFVRWAFTVAIVLSGLGALAPAATRAQDAQNTWTDPNGAYTVQWEAPWTAVRQEEGVIGVSNGVALITIHASVPLQNHYPRECVDGLILTATGAVADVSQVVEVGQTTWRAYAILKSPDEGVTSYFECQITPDGQSVALIVGGVRTDQYDAGMPALKEFVDRWIVQQQGEASPALAADGWRAGIVKWSRGSVFADIGLGPASSGEEYVVVVADVTNWQSATTELPADAFAVQAVGASESHPIRIIDSNIVAAMLGESPLEDSGVLSIPAGETRRVALVFSIDSVPGDLALSFAGSKALLDEDRGIENFGALPPPTDLPTFQSGVITSVIDGRTLRVKLDESGKQERVRLIGLELPADDAAVEQAKQRVDAYVGQMVLLESDPARPDDKRLQRYVWVVDESGIPLLLNAVLVEEELATFIPGAEPGRFDALLMAAGSNPVANEVASAPAAEPTQPVAELSEADLAYLTELKRHRDSIVQTLQYYDLVTATSTLDDKFFGHLFIILFSWSVFYDGALALEPTPMFAELDARYDAALEPFDTLAHQIEPELDQLLTGEASQPTLSGFDYDVMTATVAAARPELESVVAEIDQALTAGGIS